MSAFLNELVVKLIRDEEHPIWELVEPFSYRSDLAGVTITAPAGFRCDFCKVPRLPIVFDFLGDRARKSGVIHDWNYTWPQPFTREMADAILRESAQLNGLTHAEAELFYLAVRTHGEQYWDPAPGTRSA